MAAQGYVDTIVDKIKRGRKIKLQRRDIIQVAEQHGISCSEFASQILTCFSKKEITKITKKNLRFIKTLELLAGLRPTAEERYRRSPEGKATRARYQQSPEGKAAIARYQQSPKGRATAARKIDTKKGTAFSSYATYYAHAIQAGLKPQQAANVALKTLGAVGKGLHGKLAVSERAEAARFARRFYRLPKTKEKPVFRKRARRR